MRKLMSILLILPLFTIVFSIIGNQPVLAISDTNNHDTLKTAKSICSRFGALKSDMETCQNKHNIFASFSKELYAKLRGLTLKEFPIIYNLDYLQNVLKHTDLKNLDNICNAVKNKSKSISERELKRLGDSFELYKDTLISNMNVCTKGLGKVKELRDFMKGNNCIDPKSGKPASCYNVIDALSLNKTLLKLVAEQELKD